MIAHELAHVKHRDILISSIAATIAAAIMMVARMAMYAEFFGGGRSDDRDEGSNPIALLATMILAPMAAMLIQAAISRSREFAADAGGAAIAGNPYGLADALRKIDAASQACAARRQPGDGAHVHRQALLRRGADVALQHASANRSAYPGAAWARAKPSGSAHSNAGCVTLSGAVSTGSSISTSSVTLARVARLARASTA